MQPYAIYMFFGGSDTGSEDSIRPRSNNSTNESPNVSHDIIAGHKQGDENATKTPKTPKTPRKRKNARRGNESDDQLELTVDPELDDLDTDKQNKQGKQRKDKSDQFGGARPKTKNPKKITQQNDNKRGTAKNGSPKKRKQSVATRVSSWPSPTVSCNSREFAQDLFNDESFAAESLKVEQQMEKANRLLIQNERRAELAKKKLQAEETIKKAMSLQKQADKDSRKATAQEKSRYTSNSNKQRNSEVPISNIENIEQATDPILARVEKTRQKVKKLNPIRRARQTFADENGLNNPNVSGEDNGMNAWLDMQLNTTDFDHETTTQVKYAKKNSDNNRCYDIDDVPIKGPHKTQYDSDIQSVISVTEAIKTANELLDDDNIVLCRNSGMRTHKYERQRSYEHSATSRDRERNQPRRRPTATVTRPEQRPQDFDIPVDRNRHGRRHERRQDRWQDDYYRYDHNEGNEWDTETEYESDYDMNRQRNKKKVNSKGKKCTFLDDRYNSQRGYGHDERDRDGRHYHPYSRQDNRKSQDSTSKKKFKGEKYSSESSSDYEQVKHRKSIKSGINAIPNAAVVEQATYPHLSLGQCSGFIGQNVRFDNLSYEQFMAGELTTICDVKDKIEMVGRIQLLQRVAMWKLRTNVPWTQIRQAYAHIVLRIETHEIDWTADWDRYERHIYDRVDPHPKNTNFKGGRSSNTTTTNAVQEAVWFCKNYQRPEGCQREAPHKAKIGTMYKIVQHICASCWLRDKTKKHHPEYSPECPHKEA